MTPEHYAATVRRQVGDRYVLGAEASPTNPDPHVFDCSELVEWSYARAGVTISDGAWLQYNATVPVSAPAIGDLVFLRNNPDRPNGIGHVGIIVDAGGAIVEAKGAAYGVVTSTLAIWKQKSTYAGMRRYPAFTAAMEGGNTDMLQLLDPVPAGRQQFYRLYHPAREHFWTASIAEANTVLASDPAWVFEGPAWWLSTTDPTNTLPIYRVLRVNGKHFYTTSSKERDAQVALGGKSEGVVGQGGVHGIPVYRFEVGGGHFYTTNEAEGAGMVPNGVAWYSGRDVAAPQPTMDPLIAAKAGRYDVITAIVGEPL